jgi:UDP:flavonoid glycosyltransferase YjiC (YdhE family)
VTWEGGGTTPPELAVARRLGQRGHAVRVLGDACLAADVAAIGAEFSPFRRAPQRATRTPESEIIADWAAATPIEAFRRARDRHAYRPAGLFARDVLDVLSGWPADCVVVDAMLAGGLVGAEASGLPFAAVIPMTSFLPVDGRPPPGLGLQPARGPLGRLRDRGLYGLGEWLLWRTCLPYLTAARRSVGLPPIAHPLDQIRRADRVLILTDPGFDFAARPREGNLIYCGAELADPVWAAPLDPPLPWAADDPRPLVLVGLSSSYQAQEALLRRVIAALATLPVRALVTLGPALQELPCAVPDNVEVRATAPHAAVLPYTALTITHGGHGTVLRSLAAGVPLVVFPMGRDQSDNAARLEWLGAGRTLPARSSAPRIARAIEAALAAPALRQAARRFASRLQAARSGSAEADHGPDVDVEVDVDIAVAELEALVATPVHARAARAS